MTGRWRAWRYGSAIAVAAVGVACAATISGALGGTLGTALIGIGLVGVLSLVFYEIGLSEDRDRARAATGARQRPTASLPPATRSVSRPTPRSRRLGRVRGERRRLR